MKNEIANYKHREIMKAWLFGDKVEFFNNLTNSWEDVGGSPTWLVDFEYRIVPVNKLKELQ